MILSAIKSWPWGVGVVETLSVEVGNRTQTHVSGESLANTVSGQKTTYLTTLPNKPLDYYKANRYISNTCLKKQTMLIVEIPTVTIR